MQNVAHLGEITTGSPVMWGSAGNTYCAADLEGIMK